MPKLGKNIYWNSLPCRHIATLRVAQCRGVRRIVQCLNMLLRVQAPDEQYLDIVQHGSLLAQISEINYYKGFPKDFLGVKLKKATI